MSERRSGGGRQAIIAQFKKATAQVEEAPVQKEENELRNSAAKANQEKDELIKSSTTPSRALEKIDELEEEETKGRDKYLNQKPPGIGTKQNKKGSGKEYVEYVPKSEANTHSVPKNEGETQYVPKNEGKTQYDQKNGTKPQENEPKVPVNEKNKEQVDQNAETKSAGSESKKLRFKLIADNPKGRVYKPNEADLKSTSAPPPSLMFSSQPKQEQKPKMLKNKQGGPQNQNNLDLGSRNLLERFLTPAPPMTKYTSPTPAPDDNKRTPSSALDLTKVLEQCMDSQGSREIQSKLDNLKYSERKELINAILPHTRSLMADNFGNYVIQKVIEIGNDDQREAIVKSIENDILRLSKDTCGCRVLQKALVELANIPMFVQKACMQLGKSVMELIKHQNGNHVIQKMLEILPIPEQEFIFNAVVSNIRELPYDPYGCRVIQKLIEKTSPQKKGEILDLITKDLFRLCYCQYGNYIIQNIIERGPEKYQQSIYEVVTDCFFEMSRDKFASNVTEKAVLFGDKTFREEIAKKLALPGLHGETKLGFLMKNQYGNYVVQRLFEEGDHNIKSIMYNGIMASPQQVVDIKKDQYARYVFGFMEKYFDGNSSYQPKPKAPKSVKSSSSHASSNKSAKKSRNYEHEYDYQPVNVMAPVPVYGNQMGYPYQMGMVTQDMTSMGMVSPEMMQQMMMQGVPGPMGYIMVPSPAYQMPMDPSKKLGEGRPKSNAGSQYDKFNEIENRRNQTPSPAFGSYSKNSNSKGGYQKYTNDKMKSQTPPPPVMYSRSMMKK